MKEFPFWGAPYSVELKPTTFRLPSLRFERYWLTLPLSNVLEQVVCAFTEVQSRVGAFLSDLGVTVQSLACPAILKHTTADTLKLLQRQDTCRHTCVKSAMASIQQHSCISLYAEPLLPAQVDYYYARVTVTVRLAIKNTSSKILASLQ